MQPWEAERLKRLRTGDRETFASLVREATPLLYRIAARITRNSDDAEDLVAETFVAAWDSIRRFEGRSSLKTWLIRILVRLSRRRPRPSGVPLNESQPETPQESDAQIILVEAIQRLKPNLREALILVKVGGLSYREAAEALKSPVGTIQFRVHVATSRLRRELDIDPSPCPAGPVSLEAES